MVCPNCGKEMYKGFCMHCGYMSNGNYIKMNGETDTADLKTILGKEYFDIEDGKLSFSSLIFGPLYFCYRTYFYLGIILGLLDLFSFVLVGYINNNYLSSFNIPLLIVFIVYFLLDRAFWLFVNNRIFIMLLKRKIAFINRKYGIERDSYINGVRVKSISKMFFGIVIYIVLGVILYIKFFRM